MVGKDLPTGPLSHNVSILSTKAMWWHLGPPMPGKGPIHTGLVKGPIHTGLVKGPIHRPGKRAYTHRPGKRAYTQAW